MSYRWQRTLDGWTLTLDERMSFYKKVVKFKQLYKKCHKKGCETMIVNKKNRLFCPEHQREIWEQVIPFATPDLLEILLEIEDEYSY